MIILHSWIRRQPFMANENETNWSILAWMQRYEVQPQRLLIDHAHRGMESHIRLMMKGQHLTNSCDYLFTILPGSHFISNPAQAIRTCIQASWVRCHHTFECDSAEAWQVSSAWDGQLKSAWHLAFAKTIHLAQSYQYCTVVEPPWFLWLKLHIVFVNVSLVNRDWNSVIPVWLSFVGTCCNFSEVCLTFFSSSSWCFW